MSITQRKAADRRYQVLEVLKQAPATIPEIAETLNYNYFTIRKDIEQLVEDGHVSVTAANRNKATLFMAGKTRPMPMVFHKGSNQSIPLSDIVASFCHSPMETASSRATLDVGLIASELLYTIALAVSPNHPNYSPLATKELFIKALNNRLRTDIIHIESILGVAKDMLRDQTIWDVQHLEGVANDPLFDAQSVIEGYENYLTLKNSLSNKDSSTDNNSTEPEE